MSNITKEQEIFLRKKLKATILLFTSQFILLSLLSITFAYGNYGVSPIEVLDGNIFKLIGLILSGVVFVNGLYFSGLVVMNALNIHKTLKNNKWYNIFLS